jgi:hypothetical protein
MSPESGPSQASKIAAALASAASCVDADRSDLDEGDVAARVAEHARPLDPRGLSDLPRGNLDMLGARAESLRHRAPFAPRVPFAPTPRERTLRHYLASFGVECAPRLEGERDKSALAMVAAFDRMLGEKLRPSIVYTWAPAPAQGTALANAIRKLKRRHIEVRWVQPEVLLRTHSADAPTTVEDAVYEAVQARADVARRRGERMLLRLGAKGIRVTRPAKLARVEPGEQEP